VRGKVADDESGGADKSAEEDSEERAFGAEYENIEREDGGEDKGEDGRFGDEKGMLTSFKGIGLAGAEGEATEGGMGFR
jgi:hypothetical protein